MRLARRIGGVVVPVLLVVIWASCLCQAQTAEVPVKPTLVNLQVDLETAEDAHHALALLELIESYGWYTTVYVTGEFTLQFPALVKIIHDRGHQIGVLGWRADEDFSEMTLRGILDSTENTILVVEAATGASDVLDYKVLQQSVPGKLYEALGVLGFRSCTLRTGEVASAQKDPPGPAILAVSEATTSTAGCGCLQESAPLIDMEWISEGNDVPGTDGFLHAVTAEYESVPGDAALCVSVRPSVTWEVGDGEPILRAFLDYVRSRGGSVCPTADAVGTKARTEEVGAVVLPGWEDKPVELLIQVDLESEQDVQYADEALKLIEDVGWRTTVFVTPEIAMDYPQAVAAIEARGHQIAVHGSVQSRLSGRDSEAQMNEISHAFDAVRRAVAAPRNVVDFKPYAYDFDEQTLDVLQKLGVASITGVFDCRESYCQCWYASSLGRITFPYPLTDKFWLIPVSIAAMPDGEVALDDALLPKAAQQNYPTLLRLAYSLHSETKDPMVIAVNPSSWLNGGLASAGVLSAFLESVHGTGTKVVAVDDIRHHTQFISALSAVGPDSAYIGEKIAVDVTYTADIYCPHYRFHAYGKYPDSTWRLLDSWEYCYYVHTGVHTFRMTVEVPPPPVGNNVFTIRVVGQASFGTCATNDPQWPTVDRFEKKAELTLDVASCQCIRGDGDTEHYDLVFVPARFSDSEIWTAFRDAVIDHWDEILDLHPFDDYEGSFNVWMVTELNDTALNPRNTDCTPQFPHTRDYWCVNTSEAESLARHCPDQDTVVVLIDDTTWTGYRTGPRCTTGNDVITKARNNSQIVLHELGHSFGLADEYSPYTTDFPAGYTGCENCDPSTTCEKWGGTPGCHVGCTYQNDRRSSSNCLMRSGTTLCAVCEDHVEAELERLLGPPAETAVGPKTVPETPGEGFVYLIRLLYDYTQDSFSVIGVDFDYGYPDKDLPEGEFRCDLVDASGTPISSFRFADPRIVDRMVIPPESFVMNGTPIPPYIPGEPAPLEHLLRVPYANGGASVFIYGRDGTVVNTIDVSGFMAGKIEGSILQGSDGLVPNALVELDGPSEGSAISDTDGSYSISPLEPGAYSVVVIPPPGVPLGSERVSVEVRLGETTRADFVLADAGLIGGEVTDSLNEPVTEASLYLSGYETPRYSTNEQGEYWIPDLEDGTYVVNLNDPSDGDWHIYVNGQYATTGRSVTVNVELGETTQVDFSQRLGMLLNFEYPSQEAAEASGWAFSGLWHLADEAQCSVFSPDPTPFPSSTHAAHFCDPASGAYATTLPASLGSVSPQQRAEQAEASAMAEPAKSYGELITPEIPVSGESQVDLRFEQFREVEYYADGSYDKTYVQVQFEGGAWQTVWFLDSKTPSEKAWTEAGPITIPVPSGALDMHIKFVFDSVDNYGNDFLGWLIDDISISGPESVTLRITTQGLPPGTVDQAYSTSLSASGGTPPYTWSCTGLAPGLALDPASGTISGDPTTAGTYDVTVTVTDAVAATTSRQYQLQINPADQPPVGVLFEEDFTDAGGWTMGGLWHTTGALGCVDLTGYGAAAYYGLDDACNYDTGAWTTGMLTSPVIDIAGAVAVQARFDHLREVEPFGDGAYDLTLVEAKLDNGPWRVIWARDSRSSSTAAWEQATTSSFATDGANGLQIRFVFDTVDQWANDFVGWLVDNVFVDSTQSGTPLSVMSAPEAVPRGTGGRVEIFNAPNPVRENGTDFVVRGVEASVLRVEVYDLSGTLVWEGQTAGNELPWAGVGYSGERLANGVYLYKVSVQIGDAWLVSEIRKLVILR